MVKRKSPPWWRSPKSEGPKSNENFPAKKKKISEEHSTLKVILEEDIRSNPKCEHGPSVLFERTLSNNKSKTQFYACSAFRDKKQCPFYLLPNSKGAKSSQKLLKRVLKRPLKLIQNPTAFCSTCQILLDEESKKGHKKSHEWITDQSLKNPSKLLKALDNSKSQAQFHFSQESVEVIVKSIKSQNPSLVICIGTPSIFEALKGQLISKCPFGFIVWTKIISGFLP